MGDVDKVGLTVKGRTMVAHACEAVADARRLVVVGPPGLDVPARALTAREDPPFAGPAAALGAGLEALGDDADIVVVVAADVPRAVEVVPGLLAFLDQHPDADGVVPVSSDGHRQPLLAAYRTAPLARALAEAAPLADLSVNRVVRSMDVVELPLPDDVLADVDTPADLARLTHDRPQEGPHHG